MSLHYRFYMARIHLSKINGKNNMELKVGDVVHEVNRFNDSEYIIYQITKIFDDGGCELLVLKCNGVGFKVGRTVTGVIDCFFGGRNTKWLNYYLPAGKVLYG